MCPLIEDSENAETKLKSAEQHAKDLQKLLPHRRVAVLHGRMKNAEKDQIMRDCAAQKYDILVATTVIEVGVDVPNANLMVVEDADRFGLSQLHQLRGRVGRGADQSYCILMSKPNIAKETRQRLEIMTETTDGFRIAEADMQLCGPGDIEGTMQSGIAFNLRIANRGSAGQMLNSARAAAAAVLADDPNLQTPQNRILAEQLHRFFNKKVDWSKIS